MAPSARLPDDLTTVALPETMAFDVPDFATLMALESHEPDVYVGISPEYPWGQVYGGQVVAQGLRAAQATVDDGLGVHSLHAYFIRGGTSDEPIRYEVDRIRNGRSFATRRVVARQSEGAIMNLARLPAVDLRRSVKEPASTPSRLTTLDGELLLEAAALVASNFLCRELVRCQASSIRF